MPQIIPEPLRDTLSPLLVSAGRWPEPEALQSVAKLREEAEDPASVELDAAEVLSLSQAVPFLHGALRNQPLDERLHLDGDGGLYYQLHHEPPEKPEQEDKFAPWSRWSGWATYVPRSPNSSVFRIIATVEQDEPAPLDFELLKAHWSDVLTNRLCAEVTRDDACTRFFPGGEGPDYLAAFTRLDLEGTGTQFPHLYSFCTGNQVLMAFQHIAHAPADAAVVAPR